MTNREAERLLRTAGFWLMRNGSKHAIWTNGASRHTVAHGRMSSGAFLTLKRQLRGLLH